jgi:hypothetical protein
MNKTFSSYSSPFPEEIVFLIAIGVTNQKGSKAIVNPPGAYRMGIFWKSFFITYPKRLRVVLD